MVGLGQSPREWNKPDFTARFCKDQTLTWGQPWSPNDKHFSILSLNERWRDRASRQTCESIFTSHKLRQDDRKISHSVVGVWRKQKRKQEEPTIQTKKYAPEFMGIRIFPTKQHFDSFLAIEFCLLLISERVELVPQCTTGLDPRARWYCLFNRVEATITEKQCNWGETLGNRGKSEYNGTTESKKSTKINVRWAQTHEVTHGKGKERGEGRVGAASRTIAWAAVPFRSTAPPTVRQGTDEAAGVS